MSPTPLLIGEEIAPEFDDATRLVIFLHGLGADGHDLISIAAMLGLKNTHYLSPNAPYPCDMGPYGFQWFSLLDRDPARIYREITVAEPILNHYIDHHSERLGIPPEKIALVGFSQGSMMSLHTAPRREKKLAGVIGISGALFGPERLGAEIKSRPPICLIHGTADEVVPFGAMDIAKNALTANGVKVGAHARPGLGHGIDPQGVELIKNFLEEVLA